MVASNGYRFPLCVAITILVAACGDGGDQPVTVPAGTATTTRVLTLTPTPTPTPSVVPTPTSTALSTPTPTPVLTLGPSPSPTCFEPLPGCCDQIAQGCFSLVDSVSITECMEAGGRPHGCGIDAFSFCNELHKQCEVPPTPGPTPTTTIDCGQVCTDAPCFLPNSHELGRCALADADGCHCSP